MAREEPEPVREERRSDSSGVGTKEVFEDIGKEKTGCRVGPVSEREGGRVSLENFSPKSPTVMDQDSWTWVTCRMSTRKSRRHASATKGSMRTTTRPARSSWVAKRGVYRRLPGACRAIKESRLRRGDGSLLV